MKEVIRNIKAFYKYVRSFTKPQWNIADYPVEYRNENTEVTDIRGKQIYPWEARITHWYLMCGYGETKEAAYESLVEKFNTYRNTGEELLRPGTKMRIRFVSTNQIENYEELAVDFFKRVFHRDYYDMFISDQSSIHDFCWTEQELSATRKLINKIYNIDVSDLEEGCFVDIFKRIEKSKGIK